MIHPLPNFATRAYLLALFADNPKRDEWRFTLGHDDLDIIQEGSYAAVSVRIVKLELEDKEMDVNPT